MTKIEVSEETHQRRIDELMERIFTYLCPLTTKQVFLCWNPGVSKRLASLAVGVKGMAFHQIAPQSVQVSDRECEQTWASLEKYILVCSWSTSERIQGRRGHSASAGDRYK
jgi:hypothetical protein